MSESVGCLKSNFVDGMSRPRFLLTDVASSPGSLEVFFNTRLDSMRIYVKGEIETSEWNYTVSVVDMRSATTMIFLNCFDLIHKWWQVSRRSFQVSRWCLYSAHLVSTNKTLQNGAVQFIVMKVEKEQAYLFFLFLGGTGRPHAETRWSNNEMVLYTTSAAAILTSLEPAHI